MSRLIPKKLKGNPVWALPASEYHPSEEAVKKTNTKLPSGFMKVLMYGAMNNPELSGGGQWFNTATGYKKDENGIVYQDPKVWEDDAPEAQLRKNLGILGTTAVVGTAAPYAIEGAAAGTNAIGKAFTKAITTPGKYVPTKLGDVALRLTTGILGGEAVNKTSKHYTGNTWGENVSNFVSKVLPSTANAPQWLRETGNVAAEFTNPGYLLSLEGLINAGSRITSAGKGVVKTAKPIIRHINNYINAPKKYRLIYKTYNQMSSDEYKRASKLLNAIHRKESSIVTDALKTIKLEEKPNVIIGYLSQFERRLPETNYINAKLAKSTDIERALNKSQYSSRFKFKVNPDKTIVATPIEDSTIDTSIGTTGPYDLIHFRSGISKSGNITGGNILSKLSTITYPYLESGPLRWAWGYSNPTVGNSDLLLDGIPKVDGELREILKDNIKFVQELIPGFKPFGSSVGVSENAMTHATHDIDGFLTKEDFMKFLKTHTVSPRTLNETYIYSINNGLYGTQGDIDLNIIDIAKDGIGNKRALELYRQFFPDEYHEQVIQLSTKGTGTTPLKVLKMDGTPMTNKELLDAVDPLQKTIMDSMEINWENPAKAKHQYRLFNYLMGNNPNAVREALIKTARSELGQNGRLLPRLNLGTPELQIEVLTSVGYPKGISEKIVESGPEQVLNALDYWYLSDLTYSRSVNAGDIHSVTGTRSTIFRNLSQWNPDAGGGTLSGAGLNTTIFGPSGFRRSIEGLIQPKLVGITEGMDARQAINIIKRQVSSEGKITENDISTLQQIAPNIALRVKVGDDLSTLLRKIENFRSSKEWKEIYNKIANSLGVNGFRGSPYGKGIYFGLKDLDPSIDAIGINSGDITSFPFERIPSLKQRVSPIILKDAPAEDELIRSTKKTRYNDRYNDLLNSKSFLNRMHDKSLKNGASYYEKSSNILDSKLYPIQEKRETLTNKVLPAGLIGSLLAGLYGITKSLWIPDKFIDSGEWTQYYKESKDLEKQEPFSNYPENYLDWDQKQKKEFRKAKDKIYKKYKNSYDKQLKSKAYKKYKFIPYYLYPEKIYLSDLESFLKYQNGGRISLELAEN